MQGASWIALFRRLPLNLHDGLMLTLTTGAEVVVQRFVKLEPDYAILRGRMAGTQDNGRLVMLPYDNLVAVNITRSMKDPEIDAIFGHEMQAFAADPSASAAAPGSAPAGESAEEADAAPAKPQMPSKTELLKKLRARLGEANR